MPDDRCECADAEFLVKWDGNRGDVPCEVYALKDQVATFLPDGTEAIASQQLAEILA